MAEIPIRITELEAVLTNHRDDHGEQELVDMEKELAQLSLIDRLWGEFGDIPMNPETECLESPFEPRDDDDNLLHPAFPAGTHREDIWHWFESYFMLSVAKDLMY